MSPEDGTEQVTIAYTGHRRVRRLAAYLGAVAAISFGVSWLVGVAVERWWP